MPTARPQVFITPDASPILVALGASVKFTATAIDPDGDLQEHWLEIQNPADEWSWQGWLETPEWLGDLVGDGNQSVKSASFTFDKIGTWRVRSTAIDKETFDSNNWQISKEIEIVVNEAPVVTPPVTPPEDKTTLSVNGGTPIDVAPGTVLRLGDNLVYTFTKRADIS